MQKISWMIFLSILALSSCGRKGPLDHPKDEKRPKFDRVIDEEYNLKLPENLTPQAPTTIKTPQPIQSIPANSKALQQNSSSNP